MRKLAQVEFKNTTTSATKPRGTTTSFWFEKVYDILDLSEPGDKIFQIDMVMSHVKAYYFQTDDYLLRYISKCITPIIMDYHKRNALNLLLG